MGLPVNIESLLHGGTVEWERIEFKEGWNPEPIIRSICAFANDINNWGGGYIFVGVAEENGMPKLPPAGLNPAALDGIQKELLNLSHRLQPYYAPVAQPYVIDGKHILVIWVPGGDNRPYKAPSTLGEKGQHRYYVRRGSNSVQANGQEEQLLLEMAKRIPFDDRVAHHVPLTALNFGLIREFLEEIKSDLAKEAAHMPLPELAQQMRITGGPPEALLPINAGLLFFSEKPEAFFPGARTDVVLYKNEKGKDFTEHPFSGSLHIQMRKVLSFLQTNVLAEKVTKTSTKAEAQRVFNYPFDALEEVVANAFYHRSYEHQSPIEINCFPTRIEVLSFPGPLPPVTKAALKQKRIVARNYRNRRVGDFLKELKLTEGRSTGFPTIYSSMQENGSPEPVFETDDEFTYFLAVLPVHPAFKEEDKDSKNEDRSVPDAQALQILAFCLSPKKRSDVLQEIGLTNQRKNYLKHMEPLIRKGWLRMNDPASPNSPKQAYVTTPEGMAWLSATEDKRDK